MHSQNFSYLCGICWFLAGLLSAPALWAQTAGNRAENNIVRPYEITEERESCTDYRSEKQLFWGDTHVHTAYSYDASLWDTRNTPEDAYRFALGERVGLPPYDEREAAMRSMQLPRPLDFAMVSDHAEHLGKIQICSEEGTPGYNSIHCRIYRSRPQWSFMKDLALPLIFSELALQNPNWNFLKTLFRTEKTPLFCGEDNIRCRREGRPLWEQIQAAAERAYDRSSDCRFTSFVGYEWTAYNGGNVHRNVLFRNRRVPEYPISANEAPFAPDLWRALDEECIRGISGCDVLAIPHNSNVSRGLMFPVPVADDQLPTPHNPRSAALSARFDRLFEVMQHKGDSECWFGAGAADELCAFEKLPYDALGARISERFFQPSRATDGYLRPTLSAGLLYAREFGVNPYKFGVLASTDNHLGTPGMVEEYNFPGHTAIAVSRDFASFRGNLRLPDALEFSPGGLAAVWAEENTRDSLFAAMRRRETYGSSGPRIALRFFGAWDYAQELCRKPDWLTEAYQRGHPMGGTLQKPSSADAAPHFIVHARRDPGTPEHPGSFLQYMQIVKGWVDAEGRSHERVYDVAGDPDSDPEIDLQSCQAPASGYDRLCQVWEDPSFDVQQSAWYYARVLENPSCRWSAYACKAQGVDCSDPASVPEGFELCCSAQHRPVIRERAWSSPIWYQAEK